MFVSHQRVWGQYDIVRAIPSPRHWDTSRCKRSSVFPCILRYFFLLVGGELGPMVSQEVPRDGVWRNASGFWTCSAKEDSMRVEELNDRLCWNRGGVMV